MTWWLPHPPDDQSAHDSGELSEASGVSAVFQGCSVSLCWLRFYLGTGYLSNMGGRELKIQPVCQQRDLTCTDAAKDMVILRDWDLLTVLLHQLHNQRGYWVEGQRGSMRVCPASTAELSKCSSFFVQRTKPWLLWGFLLRLGFFSAPLYKFRLLPSFELDVFVQ